MLHQDYIRRRHDYFRESSIILYMTCVKGDNAVGLPIAGRLTFQQIIMLAGWACTAVTLALSLSLIIKHLRRHTVPAEQRQIIRMVFTSAVFAICNLLAIAFYSAAIYLTPIADLYEAFALASVFALFVHFVALDGKQHRDIFIDRSKQVERCSWRKLGLIQGK